MQAFTYIRSTVSQQDAPISPLEMFFEFIFLVLLGNIYSEDHALRNLVDKSNYPSIIRARDISSFSAFTATLSAYGGTFWKGQVVKYSRVLAHIGNCYDSSTGVFTVQTPGVYSVSASMMGGSGLHTHLTIMKNGNILVWLYTGPSYDMSSQTVNIPLSRGDKMWVQMHSKVSHLQGRNEFFNVFTAVLIKSGIF